MDSGFLSDSNTRVNIDNLSPVEKQQLQQEFANEVQKHEIQKSVHRLTDICWQKCVTGKISQGALDKYEAPCFQNCVGRYLDANELLLKQLNGMREGAPRS